MDIDSPRWLWRIVLASIAGGLLISVFDGAGRSASGEIFQPGFLDVLYALSSGLLLGASAGAFGGLLIIAARVRGPARSLTSGILEGLRDTTLPGLLLCVIPALGITAVAVFIRSLLLERPWIAGLVDLLLLCAAWAILVFLFPRLGRKGRFRISQRKAGFILTALSVLAGVIMCSYRENLEPSGIWDLCLIAVGAVFSTGVLLSLPPLARIVPIAAAFFVISIASGLTALHAFHVHEDYRETVASGWRPANWIVSGIISIVDMDGDGYSPLLGGGDCDDGRDDVNPEGIEIAGNGIDENCRGGDRDPEPPWPPRPTFVPLPPGIEEPRSCLLITIDALRPDHMSVYGYSRKTTPAMDAFASTGVRFTSAYSAAPTTRIAIPVLHAGRFLGEIAWDRHVFPYKMRDSTTTMAEVLRDKGFKTAAFVTHRYLGKQWNFTQGFDLVDESLVLKESIYRSKATGIDLALKTASWIEENARERFFIWVHIMDPHKRYLKHEDGTNWGNKPVDLYDGEIEYSDKAAGIMLDQLRMSGIENTTAVFIMADHGEFFGEHGRTTHGGCVWEEGNKIPLLIRSPGIKPSVTDCLTVHTDIAPTILNLFGIDGGRHGMSGASLVPEITGSGCEPDREVVVEMRYGPRSAPNMRSLTGKRWKLIMNVKLGTFSLYDLALDPGESYNVSQEHRDIYTAMKERLLTWSEIYANRELAEIRKLSVLDNPPDEARNVGIAFENGFEIAAVDLGSRTSSRNKPLDVVFYLRTEERLRVNCSIYHYLIDKDGKTALKEAHAPLNGTFQLRHWPIDRIVVDGFSMETRSRKLRGVYDVRIGLNCNGRRVPAISGKIDKKGLASIGQLTVAK